MYSLNALLVALDKSVYKYIYIYIHTHSFFILLKKIKQG